MKYFFILIWLMFILEGCRVDVEPSASNSAAAIIAILGELFFAYISLILFYILKICTILGGVVISIGSLHMLNSSYIFNINPLYVFIFGLLLIVLGFFQPNKPYTPDIVIAHNSWKRKSKSNDKKKCRITSIVEQIIAGVSTGIILYILGI